MINRLLKILKYLSYGVLLFILLSSVLLYIFRDDLINMVKQQVNQQLVTDVTVEEIDLSVWEHFPDISVVFEDVVAMEAIEGSEDTLLRADKLFFSFDILGLMRGKYIIDKIILQNADCSVKTNKLGESNYMIIRQDQDTTSSEQLDFALKSIELHNVHIRYIDEPTQQDHDVQVHEADVSLSIGEGLTDIGVSGDLHANSLRSGKTIFLRNKALSIQTGLKYHNDKDQLTINPSSLSIGPSAFNVKGNLFLGDNPSANLSIKAEKTEIGHLLALLPADINKEVAKYRSSGNIYFSGTINGPLGGDESPRVNFDFGFEDASFQHPDLNQAITEAYLEGSYTNGKAHNAESSVLRLSGLKGKIGEDTFKGNLTYRNFTNPHLDLHLDGTFDLKVISGLIPASPFSDVKGKATTTLTFSGYLEHLASKNLIHKTKTSGHISINDVTFGIKGRKQLYEDLNGEFLFDKNNLGITNFTGHAGRSDFQLNGFFKNFTSWLLLPDQPLEIEADFHSDHLDLDELLSASNASSPEADSESADYYFSLPKQLEVDFSLHIKEIKFKRLSGDNLGKNLQGDMELSNQTLTYDNIYFTLAGGTLGLRGYIDARHDNQISVVNYGEIKNLSVKRALYVLEDFHQDFLTSENLNGTLNASFSNKMFFNNHLQPDLSRLESIIDLTIDDGELVEFMPMIEMSVFLRANDMTKYMKSGDLSNIQFSKLSNRIKVDNDTIFIPDMTIKSNVVTDISISGTHSFDEHIDYQVSFPLINYDKRERDERHGITRREDSKNFYVFLGIKGTTKSFDIDFDKKQIISKGLEKVKDDVKHSIKVKDKQPDYYGIDTDDTDDMIEME